MPRTATKRDQAIAIFTKAHEEGKSGDEACAILAEALGYTPANSRNSHRWLLANGYITGPALVSKRRGASAGSNRPDMDGMSPEELKAFVAQAQAKLAAGAVGVSDALETLDAALNASVPDDITGDEVEARVAAVREEMEGSKPSAS